MNWEKYIKMVIRNIKCSETKKKEIKRELTSDIKTALAAGEEWQSIMERMGSPEALAAEFNENMPVGEGNKYKRGIAVWILTGVVLGMAILLGVGYLLIPKTCVISESEYFDEEAVRAQTEEIITLLDQNDMETLREKFATEKMKSVMKQEDIDAARAQESYPAKLRLQGRKPESLALTVPEKCWKLPEEIFEKAARRIFGLSAWMLPTQDLSRRVLMW